jgi:hypothetical protein
MGLASGGRRPELGGVSDIAHLLDTMEACVLSCAVMRC